MFLAALAADEAHYHGWCAFHNRQHTDTKDYNNRLATFTANKAQIVAHNAKVALADAGPSGSPSDEAGDVPGHTLKLNHFADWSREEFDRVMLPKKWKREHGMKVEQVDRSFSVLGLNAAAYSPIQYTILYTTGLL